MATAIVQSFEIIVSEWPDENGYAYWTISDGAQEKGQFYSKAEAEANMGRIMANWRCDS